MAVFQENFIRCTCGNPDFREEKIVTIDKRLKARPDKMLQLDTPDVEYRYICTKCGAEAPR